MGSVVTLFRPAVTARSRERKVHVLERRHGFMLVSPPPCRRRLAEVLAEKVTVPRERIVTRDRAELINRGYCPHCISTLDQ